MGVGQDNRRDPGLHILGLDKCTREWRALRALHRSCNRRAAAEGAEENKGADEGDKL